MKKGGGSKQTNSKSYVLIGLVLLFVFIFILFIIRRSVVERFTSNTKSLPKNFTLYRNNRSSVLPDGVSKYIKTNTKGNPKILYRVDTDDTYDTNVKDYLKDINIKQETCPKISEKLLNVRNVIKMKINDPDSTQRRRFNKTSQSEDKKKKILDNINEQIGKFNQKYNNAKKKCTNNTLSPDLTALPNNITAAQLSSSNLNIIS